MTLFRDLADIPEGWQRDVAEVYTRGLAVYGAAPGSRYAHLLLKLIVDNAPFDHVLFVEAPDGIPEPGDAELARVHMRYLRQIDSGDPAPGSREAALNGLAFRCAESVRTSMVQNRQQQG